MFTTADAAIDFARRAAREYNRHADDYEEAEIAGWLFHARYSCEGDSVWVIEKELR